jgi:hypothetical protein
MPICCGCCDRLSGWTRRRSYRQAFTSEQAGFESALETFVWGFRPAIGMSWLLRQFPQDLFQLRHVKDFRVNQVLDFRLPFFSRLAWVAGSDMVLIP